MGQRANFEEQYSELPKEAKKGIYHPDKTTKVAAENGFTLVSSS
jgi:hypothetical protein